MESAPNLGNGENRDKQAAYFCLELHREVDDLGLEIGRFSATLKRQSSIPALRNHAEVTDADLLTATAKRSELLAMLAALGHSYPCSHSVQLNLNLL